MSREDVHRQLFVLLKEKKVLDYGRCNLDSSHISHKKKLWWINASCCVASQFFSVAVFGIQTSVLRLRERSDDGIWPEALCCCPPLFCDIQRGWTASEWRRNQVHNSGLVLSVSDGADEPVACVPASRPWSSHWLRWWLREQNRESANQRRQALLLREIP